MMVLVLITTSTGIPGVFIQMMPVSVAISAALQAGLRCYHRPSIAAPLTVVTYPVG